MKDIFYVKECLGKDRKPISVYKFRTMVVGAEDKWDVIVGNGLDSYGKILNDPRIIPMGKFMRKYWIDELPQLYNLKRGDLKLVGVRPHTRMEWERFPQEIMERALRQKPGLMAIPYAFQKADNLEGYLKNTERYLREWEDDPIGTDRKYFVKITQNILFGGIRSS